MDELMNWMCAGSIDVSSVQSISLSLIIRVRPILATELATLSERNSYLWAHTRFLDAVCTVQKVTLFAFNLTINRIMRSATVAFKLRPYIMILSVVS